MNRKVLSAIFMAAAFCAPPARGQVDDLAGFLHLAGKSTLDRAIESLGDAAEINASTDGSNATVKISRSVSAPKNSTFQTLTLTASAPVDKSGDRTELATLDGLRNAFTLGGKYTWFKLGGRSNPTASPATAAKNDEICDELNKAFKAQTGETEEPTCDTDHVKTFLPHRYMEFRSLFFKNDGWMFSLGAEPKIGYQKFEFLDSATLDEEQSERETLWSVEAFLGFTPPGWETIFTIGGEYQDGFKDADSGVLCPSSSTGGTVECKTGPVGPPEEDKAELLYADVRRRLGPVGVSLRVTYDFKEELAGVDLPITFVKDKDGNLTGGLRVGWTETDHWQAGIFIGTAFSLFGGGG